MEIGSAYIIRTVTMFFTGRVKSVSDAEVVLEDAAWIADSGRWSDCLKTGNLNEVEPYPYGVTINRQAIIDYSPWNHQLPREQQ